MAQKMNWKKPILTRVELDSEQAVLAVCHAPTEFGVAWIDKKEDYHTYCIVGTVKGPTQCPTSPRGVAGLGYTKANHNAGS